MTVTIFDLLTDRCDHCGRAVHTGGGLVYLGPESCHDHPNGIDAGICTDCGRNTDYVPVYWDAWLNRRFNMAARLLKKETCGVN